jgi:hypothetical protein
VCISVDNKQIYNSLKVSSKITDTIEKIVTLEDVGITDFFKQTDQSVKQYEAYKDVLANNPTLADKLADKDLPLEEKQKYQNQFKEALEQKLGYKIADKVKTISTDEKGQGNKDVAGFISTQNDTIYSNDKNQHSTKDTIEAMGQEFAGGIQKAKGIDITTNRDQHNNYQDAIAKDTVDDVIFIMDTYHDKELATTNSHNTATSTNSNFNLEANNDEFKGLDKEMGDNKIYHVPGTFSSKKDVEDSFIQGLKDFYKDDNLQVIDNERNLENNDADRQKLADKVVKQIIKDYKDNPDEPVRLIGHSHGGNVQKIVTQKLVAQGYENIVDNVMYLGTPVKDKYKTNNNVLKSNALIYNVYDKDDIVQPYISTFSTSKKFPYFSTSKSSQIIDDNLKVQNIQVESPKTNFNESFYIKYLGDHSNIDSKEVIEQVNREVNND